LWLRGGRRFCGDGAAGGLHAEAIEDPKKKQAVLRKTKAGIKAWAMPAKAGVLVTAAAAATVAELQQHGDELKAAPEDAVSVKRLLDVTAAVSEARNATGGGDGVAEAMGEDSAAATVAEGAALPPPAMDASLPR
jgi:hypothetical protein